MENGDAGADVAMEVGDVAGDNFGGVGVVAPDPLLEAAVGGEGTVERGAAVGGEGVDHSRDCLGDRASDDDVIGVASDEGGGAVGKDGDEGVRRAPPPDGLEVGLRERDGTEAERVALGAARGRERRHVVES